MNDLSRTRYRNELPPSATQIAPRRGTSVSGVVAGLSALSAVFGATVAMNAVYGLLARFVSPDDVAAALE